MMENKDRVPLHIDSLSEENLVQYREFTKLMAYYRCAMMEVETKLNVLNQEFSLRYDRNPISIIKTRLKKPMSIRGKLERRGLEVSVENIEQHLNDVAGVRVVCSFPEDVQTLAKALLKQDDVILIEKKDYILNPKPNGYRSLHLIVAVPIFLAHEKRTMRVEIQLRTIAMDFWASLEHQLRYKEDSCVPEALNQQLHDAAEKIAALDGEMQHIHDQMLSWVSTRGS